jgi:hypothetical protein
MMERTVNATLNQAEKRFSAVYVRHHAIGIKKPRIFLARVIHHVVAIPRIKQVFVERELIGVDGCRFENIGVDKFAKVLCRDIDNNFRATLPSR